MQVSRAFGVVVLALTGIVTSSGRAAAVTPDDLLRLKQSGLGDEVLLALVDTTGVQGRIDPEFAVVLTEAGLGQRVIAAAIRRGASDAAPSEMDVPAGVPDPSFDAVPQNVTPVPQVVVVPWIVVPQRRGGRPGHPTPTIENKGVGRFINTYFHPLNDGSPLPTSPSPSSQAPKRP